MIEIRPIVRPEAAAFLQLLCEVFALDYKRAEVVFFTEPLFELERKWAALVDGEIVSILTTVGLEFGWGRAIGIAGVATKDRWRNQGIAGKLLDTALEKHAQQGEGAAMLFAVDPRLYGRSGFTVLDWVVRGRMTGVPEAEIAETLDRDSIRRLYDDWASQSNDRLRRDEQRWAYWQWNLRTCVPMPGGYVCFEGDTVREAVGDMSQAPVGQRCEWFGLESMVGPLGLGLLEPKREIALMGRNVPGQPEMFLTDQF